jgi:thymidine phosphorylase
MSTPLGRKIGNALEVEESVEVLAGGGPADVVDLTVMLAEEMLRLAGKPGEDVRAALHDGRAMDKWNDMISAQGGDPKAELPKAKFSHTVLAEETGSITKLDALAAGLASWRLGAGRARKEDPVQAGAGIVLHKVQGESVVKGEPLLTLYTDEEARFERALESLSGEIVVGSEAKPRQLLLDRIQGV